MTGLADRRGTLIRRAGGEGSAIDAPAGRDTRLGQGEGPHEGVFMMGGLSGTWSAVVSQPAARKYQVNVVDDIFKDPPASGTARWTVGLTRSEAA
jgi:hypothetical protein